MAQGLDAIRIQFVKRNGKALRIEHIDWRERREMLELVLELKGLLQRGRKPKGKAERSLNEILAR